MQQEFPTRVVKLPVREPARVTGWLVSTGDKARKGDVLCKYQLTDDGAVKSLKAPCVGVIKSLLVQESVTLQPGYVHANSVPHYQCLGRFIISYYVM